MASGLFIVDPTILGHSAVPSPTPQPPTPQTAASLPARTVPDMAGDPQVINLSGSGSYSGPDLLNAVYTHAIQPLDNMARALPGIFSNTAQSAVLIRPGNGQAISPQTAQAYYQRTGGDPEKARALAKSHGWKVPTQ